jgi:hypothetical protein
MKVMDLPLDIWAQILNVLTVRDLCRFIILQPKSYKNLKERICEDQIGNILPGTKLMNVYYFTFF